MRIVVPQESRSRILRWTQRALFAGAVSMLAYSGFFLMDGWMFQNRESRRLDHLLSHLQERRRLPPASPGILTTAATQEMVGRLAIPRLGLSVMVAEGVDKATLRRGAGHIPGTALPGQPGNVALSAHRDKFFRPLENIRRNDIITLTTLTGEYRYQVVFTKVVGPSDVAVLDHTGNEILTLVTCYPFYFLGPAPQRFIVRAERLGNTS